MHDFAALLDRIYYTNRTSAKEQLLEDYLRTTPDPERGWAVAVIAGSLSFDLFKRSLVRNLMLERADETLFAMAYDYVGEMSETIAHMWPVDPEAQRLNRLPPLSEIIDRFHNSTKAEIAAYLALLLNNATSTERWALLKLGTRGLRIGLSARSVKKVIARMANVDVAEIEELWHGIDPPYESLFAWLDGNATKPDISDVLTYTPVMLAHPIDEDKELSQITPDTYIAEWKWDGIRVQIATNDDGAVIYSRTGDDISNAFPDLLHNLPRNIILDGELLVKTGDEIGSFNDLQQRLNRKKPTKKLLEEKPAHVILYDALKVDDADLRDKPLSARRAALSDLMADLDERFSLSDLLAFDTTDDLARYRQSIGQDGVNPLIEGLMLKAKDSTYVPGRPKGAWYKWKKDPFLLDAVMMYAQRGHGKRSSYYSDYTFGLWSEDGELLPIGKAYFGFTDEELKQLDKFVRKNTTARFGPVREVEKSFVLEVAFDSAHRSSRHKSGFALRFPRIHRLRPDKPAHEADRLEALEKLVM